MEYMRYLLLMLLLATAAGAQRGGTVVITIDDLSAKYPAEEHAQIYEVLNRHNAKAIGFVIPNHAEQYNISYGSAVAEELRNLSAEGQEFGLHGYTHRNNEFENQSLYEAYYRIGKGAKNFVAAMGYPPKYFKPPFAVESEGTKQALSELGITDINANDFYEYTWYIRKEEVDGKLESAEAEYRKLKAKNKTMYLLMHVHAANYGGGLEFLDRFLSYLGEDHANIYPQSKLDLLRSGRFEYLEAAERLSDALDRKRRAGGIEGRDLFSNETLTFPATQGWDIPAEITLYQATGNEKFLERAKESADWLARNQTGGYWTRPLNCTDCDMIYTVEGGEASLGLIDLYEYTGDEKYLEPAEKWAEFLVDNMSYARTSNNSIIFEYQYPNKHWRVLNINSLSALVLLKLWKHTGKEEYLRLANESLNFVIDNQQKDGRYPYRIDWKSDDLLTKLLEKTYRLMDRPYQSRAMRSLMQKVRREIYHESFAPGESYDVLVPVQFQDSNYNSYIAMRMMQSYAILKDERIKTSALAAMNWTSSLESQDGSYRTDEGSDAQAVTYYAGFAAAAKAQAGQDFRKNARFLLSRQRDDGTFPYSAEKNDSYARQEAYILYSMASVSACYLNNCLGYP